MSEDPVFWEIGQSEDGKKVLLNPQAQNSYSYALNNPIILKDNTGRCPVCIPLVIAGATYGPQVISYLSSLATPIGQYALATAVEDAQKGHTLMAVVGFTTAGEVSNSSKALKIGSEVVQDGVSWSRGIFKNSIENLGNHFIKHEKELKELNITSAKEMYYEANKMLNKVDNKNIFKLISKQGVDIYDKSRNLLVGLNKAGEISTVHTLTDPKKYQRINNVIKKFIK